MKKIVVFPGSFNPVTIAHYRIISDAVAKVDADEGLFIATNDKYLTRKSLLKNKVPSGFILPETVRGEMIDTLKTSNPKLSFWGVEVGGASSNTYKTLMKLLKDKKKQFPGEEIRLFLIIGADKLKQFPNWTSADELIALVECLVYDRGVDLESLISNDSFLIAHRDRIHLFEVQDENLSGVSSTEIRRRFYAGEDYSSLMNESAYSIMKQFKPEDFPPVADEDIIKAHMLYDGRFGAGAARLKVFKANSTLFKAWKEPWLGERDAHRTAKAYSTEFKVDVPALAGTTVTDCVNADCVDVAGKLLEEGLNPAILNLASRTSPGGGYHKGTSAQEESLCQQSTLSQSLYQFGDPKFKHIRESGLTYVPGVYPMDRNFGGVYSPCVTFFRHNADKFYAIRKEKFDCPVITVASLSNREPNEYNVNDERQYFNADGYMTEEGRTIETNKIRTIFRIALDNNVDSLVLSAFGCGVYHLRCDEVAQLFRDVLDEPEFKNRFKKIVFAILERRSRVKPTVGKDGYFAPFYRVFG